MPKVSPTIAGSRVVPALEHVEVYTSLRVQVMLLLLTQNSVMDRLMSPGEYPILISNLPLVLARLFRSLRQKTEMLSYLACEKEMNCTFGFLQHPFKCINEPMQVGLSAICTLLSSLLKI